MHNFVFHNPTKIIFGRDTVPQIGLETKNFGTKALLVYGKKSLKKHGLLQIITDSLEQQGLRCIEHGGIKPNPDVESVRDGIAKAKAHQVDVIVAAGGGSVIDSAKAIAAGSLVEHDVWLFFRGKKSIKQSLPLLCIVTMAGSGSEMNSGMVVTNETTNQKIGIGNRFLYPQVSILDPTVTFTVPPDHTAYGAVDAISHMLEFYLTCQDPHTPLQDRLMEGLIRTIMESCEEALAHPDNYQARSNLMWSSALALNGLTAAGLGKVGFPMHAMEHSLSALYDVPHGAGLAAIMPGWLTYLAGLNHKKLAGFAGQMFAVKHQAEQEQSMQGIAQLKKWLLKINCPGSLADLKIPAKDIPHIAANTALQTKLWRIQDLDMKKIEKILHLCY